MKYMTVEQISKKVGLNPGLILETYTRSEDMKKIKLPFSEAKFFKTISLILSDSLTAAINEKEKLEQRIQKLENSTSGVYTL